MISHRYRCTYFKVPKGASTSVQAWFLAHGAGRYSFPPPWYPGPLSQRITSLASAIELYPDYFTFTFLRNPYRRFVSLCLHAHRYAKARATRIPDQPTSYGTLFEFAELCRELLADTRGLWGPAFSTLFRENPDRRYGPLGVPLRHLRFLADHARPQVDFLPDCNPERLFGVPRRSARPLSFIGAVEALDTDFRRLQDLLGLPRLPFPRINAAGPAPGAYEALYGDAAARRLIEEIYAADFAFTRCGLDDAPAPARPAPANLPRAPASRPPAATLIRRGRFELALFAISLVTRIARIPPVRRMRRMVAPILRPRRRIA